MKLYYWKIQVGRIDIFIPVPKRIFFTTINHFTLKKACLLLFTSLCLFAVVAAQESRGGKPYSFDNALDDQLENARQDFPLLDVVTLKREASAAAAKGEMLPAGKIFSTQLSPNNSGVWTVLPNKDRVWRLLLHIPDAPATSLYYENFYLPEGAVLFIYNAEKTQMIGSFGAHNNNDSKLFATEMIYTSDCVVEYYEPANVKQPGTFTITGVANVYNAPTPPASIRLQKPKLGFGDAGACNVNVNCPEGDAWANQKNSVARILIKNGANQAFCSGSLLNNVTLNCKNYFLTANHCGAATSAADKNQWIFYFNYQSATCVSGGTEPVSNTITGCTMRASASGGANSSVVGSDFLLVEFNSSIPASYNVYYAGWNASGAGSNSGVSIHHPAADIKKISTYTTPLTSRRYNDNLPDNSHWQANWAATVTSHGITEGGSSGSPLFNSNGQVVGKLSGGPSFCDAEETDKNDYYGKISFDWTANGTVAAQQLKPWLDPANTGALSLAGKAPCPVAGGCPDILEPNNTLATAAPISPAVIYNASIAISTDIDHYSFSIVAGASINVSLTNLPFDYDLKLFNAAGVVVAVSTNGGTTNESISFPNAAAGTYTIQVAGYNGAFSAANCYRLSVTLTPPPCADILEPNNSPATAALITPGTTYNARISNSTDLDYYKFTVAAGAYVDVSLTNLPADYDLRLYNGSGALVGISQTAGTANEKISLINAAAGTYTIYVSGFNGAFSTTKCYSLLATANACNNNLENNNINLAATPLAVNTDLYSQIGYVGDVDWFKFNNTTAAPHIVVTLGILNNNCIVSLYNAAGTQIGIDRFGVNDSVIFNTGIASLYYIKVTGISGFSSTGVCYRLRATTSNTPKDVSREMPLLTESRAIQIMPNPVEDQLLVRYTAAASGLQKISILNSSGQIVFTRTVAIHKGENSTSLLLPAGMPKGFYLLLIGDREPVKFIKQ